MIWQKNLELTLQKRNINMKHYTIVLDPMELEMVLNSLKYEYHNHGELDRDYWSRLYDLFMELSIFQESDDTSTENLGE